MFFLSENIRTFFTSPLEQFEILPLLFLHIGVLDFSITNQAIIFGFIFIFVSLFFFVLLKPATKTLFLIPSRAQAGFEFFYNLVLSMVVENIGGRQAQQFFPLIFSIFFFIVSLNLIGLIPYSFTITSHFIVTLIFSLTIFFGLNIICVKKHKINFFKLFLPSGTALGLSFLLVPLEIISFIFKPLSLAIRLFCNMMAGHTLLKVFAGFSWSLMSFSGILFLMHFIPLIILVPLFALELGVSLIQAFVFSLLTCMYLNDALNLH